MELDYSLYYNKSAGPHRPSAQAEAKRYIAQLVPYLPRDKNARILEIGPGNGLTVQSLAEMGYTSVTGWEADKHLANSARGRHLTIEHIEGDAIPAKLMTEKNSYDLIFCMHVIEHIPKQEQLPFVAAVKESLKAGGYFICETPNALSPLASYWRYHDWTHGIIFTPASLAFLYEANELTVLYAGAAKEGETPPRGGFVVSLLKDIAETILKCISRGICRIHYVSEFGFAGLDFPLTRSLLIVGKKL